MRKQDFCSHPDHTKSTIHEVTHLESNNCMKLSHKNKKYHFRFQSGDLKSAKGFQIHYETFKSFTACGGNYTNASGMISSPSYPNPYPKLANCLYLITQASSPFINISITMNIDCKGTSSDFIELRDGRFDESPLMGKLCGNNTSFFTTTQEHMRIR